MGIGGKFRERRVLRRNYLISETGGSWARGSMDVSTAVAAGSRLS